MPVRRIVLSVALFCAACRTPPAVPSSEPRFAIELPGSPPSHVLVFDRGGTGSQTSFSSLTLIPARAGVTDPAVTLQLDYSADGNRARIVSYAIYLDGTKTKLGEHRARLNESVSLTELENLGYRPYTVGVVPPIPPARPKPVLSSEAPSIRIQFVKQNWDSFTLALQNLSPHVVVAYSLGQVATQRDDNYETTQGSVAQPVIPAGGTVTVEEAMSGPIVVRCALFGDGSWEGDAALIAKMKARQAATR